MAARAERARLNCVMDALAAGSVKWGQLTVLSPIDKKTLAALDALPSYALARSHAWLVHFTTRWVDMSGGPLQCKDGDAAKIGELVGSEPLAAKAVWPSPEETCRKVLADVRHHVAVLRCGIYGLAVTRYRQRMDRWPASLRESVSEELYTRLRDPFTGGEIGYQRITDGVLIYVNLSESRRESSEAGAGGADRANARIEFRLWEGKKTQK